MKRFTSWALTIILLVTSFPMMALATEDTATETPQPTEAVVTATPTPMVTATPTPEVTATPTAAPTATPTVAPTEGITATPEPEATATQEVTESPAAAATPAVTATATPEAEATETVTATPEAEATATPEAEATDTSSATPTPTVTPEVASKDVVMVAAAATLASPTGLTLTNLNYKTVGVTWDSVSGATGYVVQRSDSYSGVYTEIASPTATNYTDAASLEAGYTYYYRIKAVNASSESSFSSIASIKVVPAAPTLSSAVSASATSIKLVWASNDAGADGYYVYCASSTTGAYTKVATTTTSVTTYTHTGLTTGNPYSYFVQAYRINTDGDYVVSGNSNALVAVPLPSAPSYIYCSGKTYNSLTIKWAASYGATSYVLMRAETATGSYTQVAAQSALTYTDTLLQTGVTYYYKVAAVVNSVQSEYSNLASATPMAIAPSGLKAVSKSDTIIKLTWTASLTDGYSGYIIQMAESSGGSYSDVKTIAGANTTTADVSGLTTGKQYFFKICGYTTVSGGIVKGDESSQVSCIPKPRIPTSFSLSYNTYNSLDVNWAQVSAATGYEIYRSTSYSGTYYKIKVVSDDGSASYTYTDTGLTCGTNYYYKVIAYVINDGLTTYGGYTSILNKYPLPAAPASAWIYASTSTSAVVKWDKVTGASGYEVITSTTAAGPYTVSRTMYGESSTTALISNLSTGVQRYIMVRAFNTVNSSQVRGQLTSCITVTPKPAKMTLAGKAVYLGGVLLSWKAQSGVAGYYIYSATSSTGSYSLVATITSASTTSTTLSVEGGLTRYYKARAYAVVGSTYSYGDFSDVLQLTSVPATTSITSVAAVSETSLNIKWRQTSDIKNKTGGFYLYRGTARDTSTMTLIETMTRTDILSYTDTGLETGKSYFYAVKSYVMTDYGEAESGFSPIVSGYTQMGAPTDFTVSQNVSGASSQNSATSLTLTWTGISGSSVTGYEIQYATSQNGTYTKLGETYATGTSITYNTPKVLTYNKTYYFKVRAVAYSNNTTHYGSFSVIRSGSTYLSSPASIYPVTYAGGSIKVFWSAVSEASGYHLYMSTDANTGYRLVAVTSSSTRYALVGGLSIGGTYYFKAAAYYTVSGSYPDGAWSNAGSATNCPSAPSGLSATVKGYRSIYFAWNGVSGATYFRIYRRPSGSGSYTLIQDNIGTTSFMLNGQSTGIYYDYYVTACTVDSSSNIAESPASSLIKTKAALLAPTNLDVTFNSSTDYMKLTWDRVSDASGYMVQRSTTSSTSGFSTIATLGSGDVVTYYDYVYNLSSSVTTVYYRVLGYYLDPDTLTKYGGFVSAVSWAMRTIPAHPSGLTATPEDYQTIFLDWYGISGTYYRIYRKLTTESSYSLLEDNIALSQYSVSGLATGIYYQYYVTACKDVGGIVSESPASNVITAKASVLAPTDFTGDFNSTTNEVDLSWSVVAHASGYLLQRSTSSATSGFKTVASLSGGSNTTYSDDVSALVYTVSKVYYRVIGYYEDAGTKYGGLASDVITVTRTAPVLVVPNDVSVSQTAAGAVRVSWTQNPDATGYYILRSVTKDGSYKVVGRVGRADGFNNTGLTGHYYYYKIFAYKMVSGVIVSKSGQSDYAFVHLN